jgi:hypothetical protein
MSDNPDDLNRQGAKSAKPETLIKICSELGDLGVLAVNFAQ